MNIENKRQVAIILFAIGLGLGASVLMSKVVNDKIDSQTRKIAKEYQGRSSTLVKEIDTTKATLNKLTKDYAALAQKVATQPVATRVVQPRAEKTPVQKIAFSQRTPRGKRAVTMAIDSLSAVGGLVNPGDFVDIVVKLNVPEKIDSDLKTQNSEKQRVITVLFQNIEVLAVGTNYDPIGVAPPYELQKQLKNLNITFAVNPEEVSLLTFAQENGKLQLSLRSPAETQDRVLQQVASWDALSDFALERQGTELSIPKALAPKTGVIPKKVEDEKPYIQIFRGGQEL